MIRKLQAERARDKADYEKLDEELRKTKQRLAELEG